MAETNKDILDQYTLVFQNCRYDHISFAEGGADVASITADAHLLKNINYRSYSTYRKDISSDTSLVKINETNADPNTILENFYKYNNSGEETTTGVTNTGELDYIFPGTVRSCAYATNGRELTLEDLFALFGYDYVYLYDQVYGNNKIFKETDTNTDGFIRGSYIILNRGENYKETILNPDGTVEYIDTSILYDGTYVPTAGEILSGNLYIVIQSGTNDPYKIYFNNKYMPSLFINDDKYPQYVDRYIIDDIQTLRLCDVCFYQRMGMSVSWNHFINIAIGKKVLTRPIHYEATEISDSYLKIPPSWSKNPLDKNNYTDNTLILDISNVKLQIEFFIVYEIYDASSGSTATFTKRIETHKGTGNKMEVFTIPFKRDLVEDTVADIDPGIGGGTYPGDFEMNSGGLEIPGGIKDTDGLVVASDDNNMEIGNDDTPVVTPAIFGAGISDLFNGGNWQIGESTLLNGKTSLDTTNLKNSEIYTSDIGTISFGNLSTKDVRIKVYTYYRPYLVLEKFAVHNN